MKSRNRNTKMGGIVREKKITGRTQRITRSTPIAKKSQSPQVRVPFVQSRTDRNPISHARTLPNIRKNGIVGEEIAQPVKSGANCNGNLNTSSDETSSLAINTIPSGMPDHEECNTPVSFQIVAPEGNDDSVASNPNSRKDASSIDKGGADVRRFPNLQERRETQKLDLDRRSPQSTDGSTSIENVSPGLQDSPEMVISNRDRAYNNCKAELRDARRDKRVYAAFYEAEKTKNEDLLKGRLIYLKE